MAAPAIASAFSNGADQVLANTAVLNAGGNIIYFEWNPNRPSAGPAPAPSLADVDSAVESLTNAYTTMSDALMLSQDVREQSLLSVLQGDASKDLTHPASTESNHLSNAVMTVSHVNNTSTDESTDGEVRDTCSTTPTHEAGFCPAVPGGPISCEVYVNKMFPKGHGYPLWLPQPDHNLSEEYRMRGVSIGDVGLITCDGAFDFLFNIWAAADDLQGELGVIFPPRRQTSQNSFFNRRSMISSFSNVDVGFGREAFDITYSFADGDAGAILSLPDGAFQEDCKNEKALKAFIGKNSEAWYRYALGDGRDIDRHSLYLVTGCLKSKSWGIVTYDTTVNDRHSTLLLGKSPDMDGPVYEWKSTGKATTYRTGPIPDSTTDARSRLPEFRNQCLFLRGFKISLSEKAWKELEDPEAVFIDNDNQTTDSNEKNPRETHNNSTTSSTHNEPPSYNSRGNTTYTVSSFPVKRKVFHPLDGINDLLLSQIPEARVAISHDNQWISAGITTENIEQDIRGVERKIQSKYIIGYDSGSLSCTLEPRTELEISKPRSMETLVQRDISDPATDRFDEMTDERHDDLGQNSMLQPRYRRHSTYVHRATRTGRHQHSTGLPNRTNSSSPFRVQVSDPGLSYSNDSTPSSSFSPISSPLLHTSNLLHPSRSPQLRVLDPPSRRQSISSSSFIPVEEHLSKYSFGYTDESMLSSPKRSEPGINDNKPDTHHIGHARSMSDESDSSEPRDIAEDTHMTGAQLAAVYKYKLHER